MKRIYISSEVLAIAEQYKNDLFNTKRSSFVRPQKGLAELRNAIIKINNKWNSNWSDYVSYIDTIIYHYDEILLLKPSQFKRYKSSKFSKLSNEQLSTKLSGGFSKWENKEFSEAIVDVMRYDEVRTKDIIPCIEKLGIKTCVYCNAQYTTTVHLSESIGKGAYQIDHFLPKSTYPFLCISFFNLQPSCANCNLWKNKKIAKFNLYTDKHNEIDPFRISISNESLLKYMLYQKNEYIDIKFKSDPSDLIINHNEIFHTEYLYQSFKDVVEEIIWKKKTRDDVYITQLIKSFEKLFPNKKSDINRFLYGFYDSKKNIHKRPLTKMQQDIAKQLEIIK